MFFTVFADADDSPSVNGDRKLIISFGVTSVTSVAHTRFIQVGIRRPNMVVYLCTQCRFAPLCNYKVQTPFSDVNTNCAPSSWQFNLESTNCQWHYVLQIGNVFADADDSPSVNSDRKLIIISFGITWPVLHTPDSFRSANAVAKKCGWISKKLLSCWKLKKLKNLKCGLISSFHMPSNVWNRKVMILEKSSRRNSKSKFWNQAVEVSATKIWPKKIWLPGLKAFLPMGSVSATLASQFTDM